MGMNTIPQPLCIHGAATLLSPADKYRISFDYDLSSRDSYKTRSELGRGYWDSFSVSVSPQPYWDLPLSDPITSDKLPGLGLLWGGTTWSDLDDPHHVSGSKTVIVPGDPGGNNYLNVVLDTYLEPDSDPWYQSKGTITVTQVLTKASLIPIGEQAAVLAASVVGGDYWKGAKGWSCQPPLEYVTAQQITTTNYFSYQPDTGNCVSGAGLDTSGLIYWAYNAAAGNTTYPGYPIYSENVQQLYDYNTHAIDEVDLLPGDLLFFADPLDSQTMIQVAMYVGGEEPDNVVQAHSADGIVSSSLADLVTDSTFGGFRRVQFTQPDLVIRTFSPVTLRVTDPLDRVIDHETYASTDNEFIRGIPGALYYAVNEQDDGLVYAYALHSGAYIIQVIPKPGALPADTFSLEIWAAGRLVLLAQDVRVDEIPPEGYIVAASEFEINEPAPNKLYLPAIIR